MSTPLVENTISPNPPARLSSEPGTLVPGVFGVAAVRLPGLTFGARGEHRRPGFTLVELLVVVFILLLVSAASIPVIAPALQGRHIREASRQVNSYFAVARDTSLRTGRPVGVSIERFASMGADGKVLGVPEMSVLLQQVEVPELYAGDTISSTMTIEYIVFSGPETGLTTPAGATIPNMTIRIVDMGTDVGWIDLIRVGDQIQLNHQPRLYDIDWASTDLAKSRGSFLEVADSPIPGTTTPSTSFWSLTPVDGVYVLPPNSGTPIPVATGDSVVGNLPPGGSVTLSKDALRYQVVVPYTIVRQPIKTAIPPLQLTGTVILDLNWSGDDVDVFVKRDLTTNPLVSIPKLLATVPSTDPTEDVQPIMIMFSPTGSLERIYRSYYIPASGGDPARWNWVGRAPTGPIHLMLGQRDGVPANENVGDEPQATNNWRNLDNLWVTIHPQTGLITTTENGESSDQTSPWPGLISSRYFATRAKSMGGR